MLTTVKISENAYQYISGSAHLSDRTIDEVIEDTFENRSMSKYFAKVLNNRRTMRFTLMSLAEFRMHEDQSRTLSRLLAKNSEGILSDVEQSLLEDLMQINRLNDLKRAIGIGEAIKRGLIKSAMI